MDKKILIVSGFMPYPPNFGGAIDVWERIKGFHHLGLQITLVVTDKIKPLQEEIDFLKKYVENFYFVNRKNLVSDMISSLPLQVKSREKLSSIIIEDSFHLLLIEGEFCLPIIKNKSIRYHQLIIRVHNEEATYYKALGKSAKTFKEKVYYKLETQKIRKYTDFAFKKADKLWFISQDDLKNSVYRDKGVFMPFPINEKMIEPKRNDSKTILFMGSMFMQNNVFGLDWFLKYVHPYFQKFQGYKLIVVGSTKGNENELQKKYQKITHFEMFFNQQNLKPFYKEAKLFINPMFHGSGVKVKSVNALINGLPLVSTDIGSEGIGLSDEMFWRANSTEEFITQIESIFKETEDVCEKVRKAQVHLEQTNYLMILKKQLCELE